MAWEDKLLAIPTDQWLVDQVVVLDWYDGPRAGLCALANPAAEFLFDWADEETNPDGLDLRIVRLKEIPPGSVAAFARELERLISTPAAKPVWAPVWRFSTAEAHRRAEEMAETVQSQSRVTNLLLATPDMVHFTNCWRNQLTQETTS